MKTEKHKLWENTPGKCEEVPTVTAYIPEHKKSNGAIIVFAGGEYAARSNHEGEDYALFLANHGITAFVCAYRVAPHRFPLPLLDARRTIRFVRYHSEKYGLDKDKVYVMGSSAGGHLAALTSTYKATLDYENIDEIDKESCLPNGQILCYPVIGLLDEESGHRGSGRQFLDDELEKMGEALSPNLMADKVAPKAFIWHTFNDDYVNVINSLEYAKRLRRVNVSTEVHIFPDGQHGSGLARSNPHVARWSELLLVWLSYNGFLEQ